MPSICRLWFALLAGHAWHLTDPVFPFSLSVGCSEAGASIYARIPQIDDIRNALTDCRVPLSQCVRCYSRSERLDRGNLYVLWFANLKTDK